MNEAQRDMRCHVYEVIVKISEAIAHRVPYRHALWHEPGHAEAAALADENVQRFVSGKQIKKIVVVPGKLVNIVVVE